jgi:hypothetical protein
LLQLVHSEVLLFCFFLLVSAFLELLPLLQLLLLGVLLGVLMGGRGKELLVAARTQGKRRMA